MRRNPRKAIIAIELRPNTHPESSKVWPECATLVLECGHRVNVGAFDPRRDGRQKRAACQDCGAAGEAREV